MLFSFAHLLLALIVLVLLILDSALASSSSWQTISSSPSSSSSRWGVRGGGSSSTTTTKEQQQKNNGPLQVFGKTIMEARRHLAAAAAARSTSIFLLFPVDTIKTRIQMEQVNPLRLKGIYKGVAGSLLGQVPYGVLTFGSYEIYKQNLIERFPTVRPILLYALSAVLGDLTGSGWLCPSEVVKQQLQAGMYPTTAKAVSGIWQKKGLIGFYEGYVGGIARDVPFRVAQLTSYEVTKNVYLRMKKQKRRLDSNTIMVPKQHRKKTAKAVLPLQQQQQQLSPAEAAVCGAVAGTFSAAITSPLDRIKTLLMTDSAAYGGSVASCASKIWREEGLRGFAQGLAPRVVYIAPSVVVFFIVYEGMQQRLSHWSSTPTSM